MFVGIMTNASHFGRTCWRVAAVGRRHAVAMVLDSDLALHLHPLACIAGSIERLYRAGADEELGILLARSVCDEPLHAAQWKTIGLRHSIVICGLSFHIDSHNVVVAFAALTRNVLFLDVLDEIDQRPELQAALVKLADVQQEYSHDYLFIFKYEQPSQRLPWLSLGS